MEIATRLPSRAAPERSQEESTTAWLRAEDTQLRRMLVVGFLFFLVPATIGSLSGWRWCPWPARPEGRGSIVSEARNAADTYIPFAFMGW